MADLSIDMVARFGDLEKFKALLVLGNKPTNWTIDWASEYGHIHIIKYITSLKDIKKDIDYTANAMLWAARSGHLEIVKLLFQLGSDYKINIDGAAKNGHLEVIKFLHDHKLANATTDAINWAARNGHLDVVEWLTNNSYKCTELALRWSVEMSHLEIVKFLYKNAKKLKIEPSFYDDSLIDETENEEIKAFLESILC